MLNVLAPTPSPDLLANPAWPTLSTPARLLLHEIEIALADQSGLAAAFTRDGLRTAGFARPSLDRVLAELTAQGFVYAGKARGFYVVAPISSSRHH